MSRYAIDVSPDEMTAWLCIANEAPCTLEQLEEALHKAGITYGIDRFLLQDLAEAHQPGMRYQIAQGRPPEDGLEYCFTLQPTHTPRRLADGRVDFYNLDTIQNVVQNQILVTKIPPVECRPGCTVTGKAVPPAPQEAALPEAGANVVVSADGQALLACVNGHPVLAENTLHVEPTYTLDGDVDFTVGNLTCVGNIVVMGDVKSGFSVKGAQDITVYGVVDKATLDAGGKVTLYGNVFGHQKGRISSIASVHGTYVDAATVEARKDIILTRGARHSHLCAGGSIRLQGDLGNLLGGVAQAGERIIAHNIGNENHIVTRVEILTGMYDRERSQRFLEQLAAILREDAALLTPQDSLKTTLPHDIHHVLQRCQGAVEQLTAYFQRYRPQLPLLPMQMGTVVVTGTIYPGVTVCIGEASFVTPAPLSEVMFAKVDGVIQVVSLTEIV